MDEIDAYINYRLLRSKETYSDSLILAQNKS